MSEQQPEIETTSVSEQPVEKSTPSLPPATEIQQKKSKKALIVSLVAIFSAIILLGLGMAGGALLNRYFGSDVSQLLTATNDGNETITEGESSIASVAEKVGPSVVSIVTQTRTRSYYGPASGEAAGTGIIVSKNGYVITNNHVIESATGVSIIDSAGEEYSDVKVIGRDPLNDIAFLKINSNKEFAPATLGNSATIRTGQQVVAIGNALGQYKNTVTSGIISGTGRPITAGTENGNTESLTDLIQTDASINPGNSGGPLVNMAGQIIGINTAIVEDANGIGFAIPINSTKGVLTGVLENGKVNRSYLGVNYLTVTPDVAREYNLSVKNGAYVHAENSNPVVSSSPAAQAGIKSGDVITKVNDEAVGTQGSLSSILGGYKPGDKVTLTYLRDGKEHTTTATLGTYQS